MISDRRIRHIETEEFALDPKILEELEGFWAERYEEEYL